MGRVWYCISAVVIIAGCLAWGIHGLNYGIDFTGGSLYTYTLEHPIAPGQEVQVISDTRAALTVAGIPRTQIQVSGGNQIFIRTQTKEHTAAVTENDSILSILEGKLGAQAGTITAAGVQLVGPVVGSELRKQAILALIIGNLLVLIFLTVRYEFRVAVACIVALIHDVLVMVGVMALAHAELNSEFVAAMLTIVGYSVSDSVVIFDRIRENRRLHRSADLETTTNASLLQTMARSINTVLVVLFTLVSLFVLGGPTVHPFMLALLAGMTTGMYSSIFIASPLVVSWDRWSLKRKRANAPQARRRAAVTAGSSSALPSEPSTGESRPAVSAEQAMRRAQNDAQEEKREARRERRKAKGGTGKRRF
jgi:preprotein translocase subunit SecF